MRRKNIIKNIFSNIFLQLLIIIYGFVIPRIIISYYGSEVNGLVTSITHFLGYIALFESGFGLVIKVALYKALAKKDKKEICSIIKSTEKLFRRIGYIFIVYILFLLFFYPMIIDNSFDFLFTGSLIIIIAASSLAEYFYGLTYKLFLQANQKEYIYSLMQIMTYVLIIVTAIVLTRLNVSIQLLKLSITIIFILRTIVVNRYVKKKYGIELKDVSDKYVLKQKWDALVQHIAYVVHVNTDVALLTIFSTLKEVSVYSVYLLVLKGIRSITNVFIGSVDAIFGDMFAKKELDNLRDKFELYEISYLSLTTILYTCTIILIIPFVRIYTEGVNDVNYIRPIFSILIVVAEFSWAIRQPYTLLNTISGRFKETRTGAILEVVINIVLSIVLINICGIEGVAIGTLVAMTYRTIEFMYHANKYILKRKMRESVKKFILLIIETTACVLVLTNIDLNSTSYLGWALEALLTLIMITITIILINLLVYKKKFINCLLFFRKKSKNIQ